MIDLLQSIPWLCGKSTHWETLDYIINICYYYGIGLIKATPFSFLTLTIFFFHICKETHNLIFLNEVNFEFYYEILTFENIVAQ